MPVQVTRQDGDGLADFHRQAGEGLSRGRTERAHDADLIPGHPEPPPGLWSPPNHVCTGRPDRDHPPRMTRSSGPVAWIAGMTTPDLGPAELITLVFPGDRADPGVAEVLAE